MFGHGTFVHDPGGTIAAFGSPEAVADAMAAMGMRHAWLRVHGRDGPWRDGANAVLAATLRARGIALGVWGWCDGNDVARDIANAHAAVAVYDPDAYVADIEPGVRGARWSADDAARFAAAVKAVLGARPLVVSGPGPPDDDCAKVMAAMGPAADAFAPQAYWFDAAGGPVAFAGRCLARWRQVVAKPLVVTGQAYWGEADGWTREAAEAALAAFLAGFDRWTEIAGLNWWNLAAPDGMSPRMRTAIAAARIDQKPFAR